MNLFKQEKPQICLMGATVIGRDLGPRVSSSLTSGLTADCTQLEIGDYDDKKAGKHYEKLLYQIRPAFGGNIVATIVNPDHRPQMATVRSGVMQKKVLDENGGEKSLDLGQIPDVPLDSYPDFKKAKPTIDSVTDIKVSGDTASAQVTASTESEGQTVATQRFAKENGKWVFCN